MNRLQFIILIVGHQNALLRYNQVSFLRLHKVFKAYYTYIHFTLRDHKNKLLTMSLEILLHEVGCF